MTMSHHQRTRSGSSLCPDALLFPAMNRDPGHLPVACISVCPGATGPPPRGSLHLEEEAVVGMCGAYGEVLEFESPVVPADHAHRPELWFAEVRPLGGCQVASSGDT